MTKFKQSESKLLFPQKKLTTLTDGLQYSILASSSSGNCLYIESDQHSLLLDAGLSGRKIEELMAQIDRDMIQVDAILLSHEHSDHIQGAGVLSRRYDIPLYANEKTWKAMESKLGNIPLEKKMVIDPESQMTIGNIDVLSYQVSHDAVDAQFYAFEKDKKQLVTVTDTGYVSDRLIGLLGNASAYLMESNHEIELLRYGSYPWSLKQRILSDEGHLSNEDAGLALADLIGNQTKEVYLGHLSDENNTPEIALNTVTDVLRFNDLAVNEDFSLQVALPETPTELKRL